MNWIDLFSSQVTLYLCLLLGAIIYVVYDRVKKDSSPSCFGKLLNGCGCLGFILMFIFLVISQCQEGRSID